jgi:hypothetical protein
LAGRQDTVWEAVARIWFEGRVPVSQTTRVGKIVRDLKEVGATAEEIDRRLGRYRAEWPDVAATPEAVVKHWSEFSDAKTAVVNPSVAAMRRLVEGGTS